MCRGAAVFAVVLVVSWLSPAWSAVVSPPLIPAWARLRSLTTAQSRKIQHVVVIFQENRSFDDLFQGYPGADTVASGLDSRGRTIPLRPISLRTQYGIDHSAAAFLVACDGTREGRNCRMDGFNREVSAGGPAHAQYAYVPHDETRPYFDLAREFVLGDRMFQSQIDESFVAHQYIIAGSAGRSVDLPLDFWGCDGTKYDTVRTLTSDRSYGSSRRPCFDHETLADELDAAGLPWRFYTGRIDGDGGEWSGFQAIRHIRYGPDWKSDVIAPQKRFFTDLGAGFLGAVTWITPTCANSDHPNCGGGHGPDWVASVVNAIGQSPFWDSTAIFVTWDDWGGLYDHVPPKYLDYDGLGFRVPLLVISPYAKQNYVSHQQYEFGSILRFAEDTFGLARLAAADRRATSPASDCFDFRQPPRRFVTIPTQFGPAFFLFAQPPDGRPPDDA